MQRFPQELKYSPDHTWLRLEEDGRGQIGITEAFLDLSGQPLEIEFIGVEGDDVSPGKTVVRMVTETDEWDISVPVDGKVVEFNLEAADAPEIIYDDPYEDGWLVRVELESPLAVNDLMSTEEYEDRVADMLAEYDDYEEDDEDYEDDEDLDEEEDEL